MTHASHRLRDFVQTLRAHDEVREITEPVSLDDISAILESSPQAVHFHQAGPEGAELVGNVMASRARMGLALQAPPRELAATLRQRLATPQEINFVDTAPVQQIIRRGKDADLRRLPFYLQHDEDGGVYISSALDFCVDPATGARNLGSRRLFLRGHQSLSTNLSQPSDLRRIYLAAAARGENLPISFVIGTHPLDFLASALRIPGDEFQQIARLRGQTLDMVRGVTNGVPVPADAEMVIEGYLDPLGHRLPEGPYGEFWGLNGEMHINPLFHVTAITARADALHHTVSHGGRDVARMEASILAQITTEALTLTLLEGAGITPHAVYASPNAAVVQHVRIALPRAGAHQARAVIERLHAHPGFRFVQIVDDDIDVFDDAECEWTLSTRFRADRDLIVTADLPGIHADPTRDAAGRTAKLGLDCTAPPGAQDHLATRRPRLPSITRHPATNILAQLANGPANFRQLLAHSGTMDARDLAIELDAMLQAGLLRRLDEGDWSLPA